jgi:periplasmic divalent cation tolerance protein
MAESFCVILTTVGNKADADRLAELLVFRQLAACVQATAVSSVYAWNGALHKDSEHLLLIKTRAALYDSVQAAILENHSYEVPEIVQLPVQHGLDRYLDWIVENTSPASEGS